MALEAAYAFNDVAATTVTDLSGNGRHATLTGTAGVQVSGGQTGGALGKTGATMPVLPASVLSASQTDDRTVMFDAQGNLTTWWVRWEKDAINSGAWGVLNVSGSMAVQARRASDDSLATRPTGTPPAAGVWHNYAATYVRSTGVISLYRDGVLVDSEVFAAGTQLTVNADRINLAEWSTTGPAIDNLRIYSHALNSTDVAAVAGTPVTSNDITGSGAATAPVAAVAGAGSVVASGAGGASAPASTATGTGTVAVGGGGSLTSPVVTAVGEGSVYISGAGLLLASVSIASGVGAVAITGSGQATAPPATSSGSDLATTVTPPRRTLTVPPEGRTLTVPAESRRLLASRENRTAEV